jgi:very-short-patch-repair endonuclease
MVRCMTTDLARLLAPHGVRPVGEVLAEVDPRSVSRWVAAGKVVRPLPGVLALPATAGSWQGRARSATLWSGGQLTGRTALALWDLVEHPGARTHVAVGRRRHVPPVPDWLRVHRAPVPEWSLRDGLELVTARRALVDAWGVAHERGGTPDAVRVVRAAVIGAVRRRVVTPAGLRRELARHPVLPGRRALSDLVDLVAGGSHSEFEIWGLVHLLDIPGLPPVQRQFRLATSIGTVHLDGALEAARLAIELDGAAYHRAPDQREHDLRRDAAVLAEGWATIRISHRRGHAEPAVCRREIATAFHARMR